MIMKTGTAALRPLKAVKVLDQLRERICYLHHSLRTQLAYVYWVQTFGCGRSSGFTDWAIPCAAEVGAFLGWPAAAMFRLRPTRRLSGCLGASLGHA
jgi:hypothetical protein